MPYEESVAIAVLPAVGGGRLENPALRRWLGCSDLEQLGEPAELLARLLGELDLPCPGTALGALRMWGQTGDRPTVWIAAADPVYLEPRLNHLCLYALDAEEVPATDLRPLFDHLQLALGEDSALGFARLGTRGYLRSEQPFATADVPSYVVHQDMPNEYMPAGDNAAQYRQLVSEIEMALHDHAVNRRRQDSGKQPVNCLWLWGGGFAPEQTTEAHPPLFCDDPLLTGHWMSKSSVVSNWPGDIMSCAKASPAGFVAVVPDNDNPELLERCLSDLRTLLHSGRLRHLTLMFRDGIEARICPSHRWRFWRRRSPLLD